MDAERHEQQRMGDGMPEGAHRVEREPVSGGLSDLLRGATYVPGGVEGQPIVQKSRRKGRRNRETECDVYGENMVKATLPSGGLTYHHNGIN